MLPASSVIFYTNTKLNWSPDFLKLGCKVFFCRHRDGAAVEVKQLDVDDVQFTEEPPVVLRPAGHVWVAEEESLPGRGALL